MNRTSLPAPEQKEHARHGEQLFPLQKYITTLDDLHPSVSAHWHEEAEFTRILSGSGTYQIQLPQAISSSSLRHCCTQSP